MYIHMPTQHLYLTQQNFDLLRKEGNMSQIVNSLLDRYFRIGLTDAERLQASREEYEDIKQKFEKVNEEREKLIIKQSLDEEENKKILDEKNKLSAFFEKFNADSSLENEYKDGVKENKWKGVVEFARIKIAEEEADDVFNKHKSTVNVS